MEVVSGEDSIGTDSSKKRSVGSRFMLYRSRKHCCSLIIYMEVQIKPGLSTTLTFKVSPNIDPFWKILESNAYGIR